MQSFNGKRFMVVAATAPVNYNFFVCRKNGDKGASNLAGFVYIHHANAFAEWLELHSNKLD